MDKILTDDERLLISYFRLMTPEEQQMIMDRINELVDLEHDKTKK